MRLPVTAIAVAALAVGSATGVAAQQSWAITPYIGYVAPLNNFVEYADATVPQYLQVEPTGGVLAGVSAELGLSKQFALSAFINSTLGLTQKATWHYRLANAGGTDFDFDYGIANSQFGATFIVRPLGRLPNGAPKVFYLEAGAGLNHIGVSDVQDRSNQNLSWNANSGIAIFGGGLTFRIGPRSTLVIFGRYNMGLSEYSSAGLDDWNSVPPPDPGQKVNLLTIGAGLRTGH